MTLGRILNVGLTGWRMVAKGTLLALGLLGTHAVQAQDVSVRCMSGPLRPGREANVWVELTNHSAAEAHYVFGAVELDPSLEVLSASQDFMTGSEGELVWKVQDLMPGATHTTALRVRVPQDWKVGQTARLKARSFAALDRNAENDRFELQAKVAASGGTDKLAWDQSGENADGPTDPSTSQLLYQIRFQNTSSDTVATVVVRDTIDTDLNLSTLVAGGSSSPYQLSVSGNVATFTFNNINLPDSLSDPVGSQGYVSFVVDLNPGLPLGTVITNRASISFDAQPAVLTNTTASTLCTVLNTDFSFTQNGTTFSFTDQSDASAMAWAWDFGDGGTSVQQNPSHTYASMGVYNVCLTATNACRTETYCNFVALVGAADPSELGSLQVFPNPSSGKVQLQADWNRGGALTLRLWDAMGQSLSTVTKTVSAGAFATEIDLGGYPSGIYFLGVDLAGKRTAVRLVRN